MFQKLKVEDFQLKINKKKSWKLHKKNQWHIAYNRKDYNQTLKRSISRWKILILNDFKQMRFFVKHQHILMGKYAQIAKNQWYVSIARINLKIHKLLDINA